MKTLSTYLICAAPYWPSPLKPFRTVTGAGPVPWSTSVVIASRRGLFCPVTPWQTTNEIKEENSNIYTLLSAIHRISKFKTAEAHCIVGFVPIFEIAVLSVIRYMDLIQELNKECLTIADQAQLARLVKIKRPTPRLPNMRCAYLG